MYQCPLPQPFYTLPTTHPLCQCFRRWSCHGYSLLEGGALPGGLGHPRPSGCLKDGANQDLSTITL